MIGSSLPSDANEVKSRPKLSRTGVLDFLFFVGVDLTENGFSSIESSLFSESSSKV